jgi:hypothetical protein
VKDDDGALIPDLGTEHWFPPWEVSEARNIPVNFYIGASETAIDWMGQQGWPSLPRDLRSGISGAMIFFNNGKVGVDNCLFETDFPHPTSQYPIENLEARLGDLNGEERAKVLGGKCGEII